MIVYQITNTQTNKVIESKLVLSWDTAVRKCLEFIPNHSLTEKMFNDLYEKGVIIYNNLTLSISKIKNEEDNSSRQT